MDARPVKIILRSSIEKTEERFEYEGLCRVKGSLYCITYTDRADSALSRVRMDAGREGMTLHRRGSINTRMQFDPRRETPVSYSFDAFRTDFILKTKEYRFSAGEASLQIFVRYTLTEKDGQPVSEGSQEMEIIFTDTPDGERAGVNDV